MSSVLSFLRFCRLAFSAYTDSYCSGVVSKTKIVSNWRPLVTLSFLCSISEVLQTKVKKMTYQVVRDRLSISRLLCLNQMLVKLIEIIQDRYPQQMVSKKKKKKKKKKNPPILHQPFSSLIFFFFVFFSFFLSL